MRTTSNFNQAIVNAAIFTAIILTIPLVAMQYTDEVNWTFSDFLIMAVLLMTTATCFALIIGMRENAIYRVAFSLALATTFFMVWANLAVGLIAGGPNVGNLMYAGVLAVAVTGSLLSHFRSAGMERAMYATAGALVLHTVVALLAGMGQYPGSSVMEIIGVNGFFTALFAASGLLFRFGIYVSSDSNTSPQEGN
jgi:hypothetical protein